MLQLSSTITGETPTTRKVSELTEASTRRPFSKEPSQVLSPPSWQLGLSEHGGNTRVYPIPEIRVQELGLPGHSKPQSSSSPLNIAIFHVVCVISRLILCLSSATPHMALAPQAPRVDVDPKWMKLKIGYKMFKCEHTVSKF